jgi:hypothetical protein
LDISNVKQKPLKGLILWQLTFQEVCCADLKPRMEAPAKVAADFVQELK